LGVERTTTRRGSCDVPPGGAQLSVALTIPLLLVPRAVVNAASEGMFSRGSAKLPANGTRYLRRLRDVLTGAKQITCTGHTDNHGSTGANQRLGLKRAKAVPDRNQQAPQTRGLLAERRHAQASENCATFGVPDTDAPIH
jgi:outer membrane protein OmpA-like peptidoglycan-associated protein